MTDTIVYADWPGMSEPTKVGILSSDVVRRTETFRFEYSADWLTSEYAFAIDPDLSLFRGQQFAERSRNFRVFLDSSPDRWGRLLIKRREAVLAKQADRRPRPLTEMDYLLGVHDSYRMGGLRFKLDEAGPFKDDNPHSAAPPMTSLKELEFAAERIEDPDAATDPDYIKWLHMLISPGSSLGGARPKACVIDAHKQLWIAKFPSRLDSHNIGAWEFITHKLALAAGITMAPCQAKRFNSDHLRNHGFMLDLELARECCELFMLDLASADTIISEVVQAVSHWSHEAAQLGLSRAEMERMAPAFSATN